MPKKNKEEKAIIIFLSKADHIRLKIISATEDESIQEIGYKLFTKYIDKKGEK